MTVAGKGERRRYYCANAKEKGASVCTGMPGVKDDGGRRMGESARHTVTTAF